MNKLQRIVYHTISVISVATLGVMMFCAMLYSWSLVIN